MAYDYLGLTNEVLARMNEVELTASNFSTGARGFQVQCKNAVNDAINYVNQRCLLYTSPSPRDGLLSRMPSSA